MLHEPVEKLRATRHHTLPPPCRLLNAVVVGNYGKVLRRRALPDQQLDEIVGLIVVNREHDMNSLMFMLGDDALW